MPVSPMVGFGARSMPDNSTEWFAPFGVNENSANSFDPTETEVRHAMRDAGNATRFQSYVSSNSINSATGLVLTLRDDGVDTTHAVTYTSNQTGGKVDTDTVAIAAGSFVAIRGTTASVAGNQSVTITMLGFEWTPTDTTATETYLARCSWNSLSSASANRYVPLSTGWGLVTTATEASSQVYIPFVCVITDASVYISANPRTTDTTFAIRVNEADSALSIIYTSGQTGEKTDSDEVALIVGDYVCWVYRSGTGTEVMDVERTTVTLRTTTGHWLAMVGEQAGPLGEFNANTKYIGMLGSLHESNATEANVVGAASVNGFSTALEVEGMFTVVASNAATGSSTVTFRSGLADTILSVEYTTGQTGRKADTDVVWVTSGTRTGYKVVSGGTGDFRPSVVASKMRTLFWLPRSVGVNTSVMRAGNF